MHLRYEINRSDWTIRSEFDADVTLDRAIEELKRFAVGYPHRLFVDGKLVAEITTPRGERSKVVML
jgi:hypothetical protein